MKKAKSHFPKIKTIAYEGPQSANALAFKHYNPDEVIDGQTLSAHLRFSVAYWHAFRGTGSDPFGPGTIVRPWEKGRNAVSIAKTRMDAAFEFFQKIRAPFWCFHDRDIAPEGRTLAEVQPQPRQVVAHAKQLQKATGVRLLWGTANLFSNPRYMCGASTNPDAHVFAYAAAQVKAALDVTKQLGGENYVFWGGREGYETLLNTNLKREQDHLATLPAHGRGLRQEHRLQGPVPHRAQAEGAHQAPIRLRRRQRHRLPPHLRPRKALQVQHRDQPRHPRRPHLPARDRGRRRPGHARLDRRQRRRRTPRLGHRPVQHQRPRAHPRDALDPQGRRPRHGGFNFDAKLRRPSIDLEDLFHAHIGGMDAYALAFKLARRILADGRFESFLKNRYASYDTDYGRAIEKRRTNFRELNQLVLKKLGEPKPRSGKQEYLENMLMQYLHQ
jgi:xylose isomerase